MTGLVQDGGTANRARVRCYGHLPQHLWCQLWQVDVDVACKISSPCGEPPGARIAWFHCDVMVSSSCQLQQEPAMAARR